MIKKVKNYLSLVKFSHTIFAMPFAVIGYFMAVTTTDAELNWQVFLMVILAMVFARNAAMAFNRFADREIDAINPRTLIREIPAGIIKPKSALRFVILNSILFILTTYFINTLTLILSPVALFVILGYSLTKRFTSLCHFVLGIGLSLAPIGAYLAVTGTFHITPVLLSFVVLAWVSGFDIIYALQDDKFDKENSLRSLPAILGRKKALIFSVILHFLAALLVFIIGIQLQTGVYYWIAAGVFIILLFYQHSIVRPNDLSRVNLAFFTLNGIASLMYCTFVVLSLFL